MNQAPAHATQQKLGRSSSGISAGGRPILRNDCYEEEAHVRRIGEHAVVIGGSMAGLLAARSLAEAYERVTVIERDALPAGLEGRRAVPQGRHAHALLPHGQACLDALLPGFSAELAAAGAPTCAALEEMRFVIGGHQLARASTGASSTLASRPFIEGHVRRRIRELPRVTLIDGCDALGLTTGRHGERITGVRVLRRADGSAEETLAADLVVAATGRAARIPAWLQALGYESPAVERLKVGVTYASRPLSLPADPLDGDKFVLIGARPGHPRTLFLFAQEDGRWILGLGGYGPEHRPPSDPEGFAAFAATVAPPDVLDAIEAAEPLDEIATHRFSASVRRRYDRLRSFPAGLLVAGDAICSFNPTYGQGMTVAAAQAVALRDCLERGERDLARRFFRAASVPIDHAWELSVGADLALPEIEGTRSARVRLVNAYLRRLRARAEHDPAVAACPHRGSRHDRTPTARAAPRDRRPRRAGPAPRLLERAGRRGAPARSAYRRSTHPAARGRTGGRRRGRRLPARQPGLERGLGAAARRRPAAAGVLWRGTPPDLAKPSRRSRFGRPSPHTRSSSAARSTRSGSSASISSHTTSVGPGAWLGQPASPIGSPAPSCSAPERSRAIAGMRSPGCGAPRTPVSCSWPRRPASAFASCYGAATRGGFRGRSSTACTTTSTARPVAPFSISTAPSRTWRATASGSPRPCARSTGPRSCSGAVTTPTCPSPMPSASAQPSRARRSASSSEVATGPSSMTRPPSPRR